MNMLSMKVTRDLNQKRETWDHWITSLSEGITLSRMTIVACHARTTGTLLEGSEEVRVWQTSQVMPLDQLLKDEEFPETERLLRSTGLKHLAQVADRKGKCQLLPLP
ncbi:hypothetical protein PR048_027397 [Dryococelus australis]|uniref:Uncharacterized protein n=1 Tax=Dryococelus australis TaxID=614101 RepID=A0ABQ9GGH5_9NEOP|nr:hypothetical protein PR048_027397 [Dryococelus australis]